MRICCEHGYTCQDFQNHLNCTPSQNKMLVWLVVWLPIGFLIIPIDEIIFFRGIQTNHQPVVYVYIDMHMRIIKKKKKKQWYISWTPRKYPTKYAIMAAMNRPHPILATLW